MLQADLLAAHLSWWLTKGAQEPTLKNNNSKPFSAIPCNEIIAC